MKTSQEIDIQNPPPASSLPPRTYLGIDNGLTGAVSALFPDDTWHLWPVAVEATGRGKQINIAEAKATLESISVRAGGIQNLVATCELAPVHPRFSAKSNHTCGRCGEFWRVLLTLLRIPFEHVKAQVWQKEVFNGVSNGDPKQVAADFVRNRFPGVVESHSFTKPQRQGVVDAMCIAAWSSRITASQPPSRQ